MERTWLQGGESSNTKLRTTKDSHNTIVDAGVAIKELHIALKLAVWHVQLTHLQDNHIFWIPYHRTSLVWACFLLRLQGIKVDVKVPQTMRCVLCHLTSSTPTVYEGHNSNVLQCTICSKKGILNYNPANGSTSMMKYVMNDHATDKERYKDVVAATDADGKKHN